MGQRWLAAVAVTCAITTTAGCGFEKPEPPPERQNAAKTPAAGTEVPAAPEPEFLTLGDLDRYESGDPRGAVLDFWFAIQYRDLLSAYETLTTEFRGEFTPSLRHFGTHIMADHARWLTKPTILFVQEAGARASVAIEYPGPGGGPERSSFALEREGGRWKVAYEFYLSNRLLGK